MTTVEAQFVYRNQGNGREDAAYVIEVRRDALDILAVHKYYGKWNTFMDHGTDRLNGSKNAAYISESVYRMKIYLNGTDRERENKGYSFMPELSIFPVWPLLSRFERYREQAKASVRPPSAPVEIAQPTQTLAEVKRARAATRAGAIEL